MASSAATPTTQNLPLHNRPEDLWLNAFNSLPADVKATLASTNASSLGKIDELSAVIKAAEDRLQTHRKECLKYTRANGEVIIVRDLLEKIVRWVNRFIAAGDVAVQFDPVHAALPWAAFRFLLQSVSNVVGDFPVMISDVELLTGLVARCRELERLHPQASSMEEPLTKLYAAILAYLARAIRYWNDSRTVRALKSPFRSPDTERLRTIQVQEEVVWKHAALSDTAILNSTTTALNSNTAILQSHTGLLQTSEAMLVRLSRQADLVTKELDEAKHLELVKWLSTSRYPEHHEFVSSTRIPGFGTWLLQHSEYLEWVNKSASFPLLLHGILGSGKSTLCSVVIDFLIRDASTHPDAAPFAYYYCDDSRQEAERSDPEEIMRCLLRQLTIHTALAPASSSTSVRKVRDFLWSEWQRRQAKANFDGFKMAKLKIDECVKLILELGDVDPITIIIDAVDRLETRAQHMLIEALKEIIAKSPNIVKVLITSRNHDRLSHQLPDFTKSIAVSSADTAEDMGTFVKHSIDSAIWRLGERPSDEMRAEIYEKIVQGAGEMFLWAKVQVESLSEQKHEGGLREALDKQSLLKLSELYDHWLQIILRSGEVSRRIAVRVFSWLLYMEEPLRPDSLLSAVAETNATEANSSTLKLAEMISLCENLIVEDKMCGMIRFAHQSVQEFISSQNVFQYVHAQRLLASSCINVCCNGPPVEDDFPSLGLYRYATIYWAVHFHNAESICDDDELRERMLSFIFEDGLELSFAFENWRDTAVKIADTLPREHKNKFALEAGVSSAMAPRFLASVFGLKSLLDYLIPRTLAADWNKTNTSGRTPLYLAATAGHLSVVEALMAQDCVLDVEGGWLGSPLHGACFQGHDEVVRALVKSGASFDCGSKFESALEATFQGYQQGAAITLLDAKGPSGETLLIQSCEDYEAAFQGAGQVGFEDFIARLQSPPFVNLFGRSEPDKQKQRLTKPLRQGRLGLVRDYLRKSQNSADALPEDAVALASAGGHNEMVAFLLDMGKDIEFPGDLGTPLRTACLLNHYSTARLLLDRGAKIDRVAIVGTETSLTAASGKGHTRVVRLLIENGALGDQFSKAKSAVKAAASHGHGDIVHLLLDVVSAHGYYNPPGACAEMDHVDLAYHAFHAAARGGHYEIVTSLSERGYEKPSFYPRGRSGYNAIPQDDSSD